MENTLGISITPPPYYSMLWFESRGNSISAEVTGLPTAVSFDSLVFCHHDNQAQERGMAKNSPTLSSMWNEHSTASVQELLMT